MENSLVRPPDGRQTTDASTRAWVGVAMLLLAIAVFRGLRFPSLFTYTHFLLDYSQGFVKRGLLGTLFGALPGEGFTSYPFFVLFSLVLCAVNFVLLAAMVRRFVQNGHPWFTGAAVLFASSLSVTFLAHTVGYSDHIGLLTALITLHFDSFYKRAAFLAPAFVFTLVIHEAQSVLFFPVLFALLLLDALEARCWRKGAALALLTLLIAGMTCFMLTTTLEPAAFPRLLAHLQDRQGELVRPDVLRIIERDLDANFEVMGALWGLDWRPRELIQSLLTLAPVFVPLLIISAWLLHRMRAPWLGRAACLLAPLSPIPMNFIAWDINRWSSLVGATSFLLLYGLFRKAGDALPAPRRPSIHPVFLVLFFLSAMGSVTLFDHYTIRDYPFTDFFFRIWDVFTGDVPVIPVPDR